MSTDLMWWGYKHANGQNILKRWFGDVRDYTDDCEGNPFVQKVCPPFAADTREEAQRHLDEFLGAAA